jgi:hypothetical protein
MGHNGLKRHKKACIIIYYDVKAPGKRIINLERIKLLFQDKQLLKAVDGIKT